MIGPGDHEPNAAAGTANTARGDAWIAAVRQSLLAWYRANERDLPWRRTRDPYEILVSEVMLQQTQVDRVIPYYAAFLNQFPTVEALGEAPTAAVIRSWAGLGYNRRAVNLQRTAQAVVARGGWPRTPAELQLLPGVGPYTAGAIACFAFEQDVAFVDTNMRRFIHRLRFGPDLPKPTVGDRSLLEVAAQLVPPGQGWEWNQALIEFGALQCTAREPACVVCPLQQACRAYPAIQTIAVSLPRQPRARQDAPFHGSNRYYRGRILDVLRGVAADDERGVNLPRLGAEIREGFEQGDLPWLYSVVNGLVQDGLAVVSEERASYDVSEADSVSVRLPR